MTTKLSRRTALTALASTAAATAAGAESLHNRLMHIEHVKPDELRQLGYDAAAEIKRLRGGATVAGPDPIFAAIARHRAAMAAMEALDQDALEEQFPDHSWHWRIGDEIPPEGCTDDPRWIAAQLAVGRVQDEHDEALTDMLSIAPTTVAGVAALLEYLDTESWEPPQNYLQYFSDWRGGGVSEAAAAFLPLIAATLRRLAARS
jgi:hypothetical protein